MNPKIMNLQGTIQGALYGARALAQGTGPIIFAAIFAAFTREESPFPKFAGMFKRCHETHPTMAAADAGIAGTHPVDHKTAVDC